MKEIPSSKFYVYLHRHPETQQVVYVGKGTAGRAWACGTSTNAKHGRGTRTPQHQEWIDSLLDQGYTPADFVKIVKQGLDSKTALTLELELTEQYKNSSTLFNVMCYGTANSVLTPEQLKKANGLREEFATSYSKIAQQIGATPMTVWRALNKKTKSYSEEYTHV
jgi:hypothetical protein